MGEKQISTLVEDINELLVNGLKEIPDKILIDFKESLFSTTIKALTDRDKEPTLRMSNIGKPCERQLWYELNTPNEGEKLRAEMFMKFTTGHVLEELLLFLADRSGHIVTGRQDELEISGIKGHRDCIIDGMLIDCKSASTYSYKKFKEGLKPETDSFGYLGQLRSYAYSGRDDPLVTIKNKAGFLVIDKTLGHICLDIHEFDFTGIEEEYERKKTLVASEVIPDRGFQPEPFGKSGNMMLGTNCSYCSYNKICHPGLRTFLYSTGPKYLTQVVREPDVPELGVNRDVEDIE